MALSLYSVLAIAIIAASLDSCSAVTAKKLAELTEAIKPTLSECGAKYGITIQDLTAFKANSDIPDDSKKCFLACVLKKLGLLDSKGLYSEEVALKNIAENAEEAEKQKAITAAKTCTSVNQETVSDGDAGCDRAKLLFDCTLKEIALFGVAF